MSSLPVPRMNPASVLPMPVANWPERARHASVRIRAEKHFAGPDVPFFGQRRVADAREAAAVLALQLPPARVEMPRAVGVVDHVVKIGQPLLPHELAQDIDVAVREAVRRENVMVRDDDDFLAVPDLGGAPELAVKHADGPRPANIVREENVRVDPKVVAGNDLRAAAGAGEDGFGERHLETESHYCIAGTEVKSKIPPLPLPAASQPLDSLRCFPAFEPNPARWLAVCSE